MLHLSRTRARRSLPTGPLFVLLLLAAALAGGVADASPNDYADELVKRAQAEHVATERQWLRLGHWRQSLWHDGWLSEVDGGKFFLSKNGKKDPEAELAATIRAFFTTSKKADDSAVCKFPARFFWLVGRLRIDPGRLTIKGCPAFETYMRKLQPRSIVVTFSSYFMESAASAFGHTFLRIEKHSPYATEEKRKLLDFGIDYSANVTTSNSILYAWLGMTGGFRGTFKRLPFYYKVREYSDHESRDLWDYRLNLTPAQVALVVAHVWELGPTYFDYFYLTENCSYHILSLIEIANPELELLDKLKTPVLPADTIRALINTPGLVAEVTYWPSLTKQFRSRVRGMSGNELATVRALTRNANTNLSAYKQSQRVRLLDAAADLLDVEHGEDIITKPKSHAARTKHKILEHRAQIQLPSDELVIEPPWKKQPHVGHGTRRFWVGSGSHQGPGGYLELALRLTLHDLVDPPAGYPELTQIEFLPTRLRLYDHGFSLEHLSLVRIHHVNPIDRFNKSLTWKLDIGGTRIRDAGCADCFTGSVVYGNGLAVSVWHDAVAVWATLDLQAQYAPTLDGLRGSSFRLGVGPATGLRIRWHRRLLSLATLTWMRYPYQTPKRIWTVDSHLRWSVTHNVAIDAGSRLRNGNLDAQLALLFYY